MIIVCYTIGALAMIVGLAYVQMNNQPTTHGRAATALINIACIVFGGFIIGTALMILAGTLIIVRNWMLGPVGAVIAVWIQG